MKITRRQLKKLISEVQVELSPAEISAAKKKLEDEGGAAGLDMVAKAINDAEEEDTEIKDEEALDALMAQDEDIVQHSAGDIIDKGGITDLAESLNSKKLRRIIKEELKRLSYVSKEQGYTYGIDHIRDRQDQKKTDDIIGHT
jgi:hypothetical protein